MNCFFNCFNYFIFFVLYCYIRWVDGDMIVDIVVFYYFFFVVGVLNFFFVFFYILNWILKYVVERYDLVFFICFYDVMSFDISVVEGYFICLILYFCFGWFFVFFVGVWFIIFGFGEYLYFFDYVLNKIVVWK